MRNKNKYRSDKVDNKHLTPNDTCLFCTAKVYLEPCGIFLKFKSCQQHQVVSNREINSKPKSSLV